MAGLPPGSATGQEIDDSSHDNKAQTQQKMHKIQQLT